MPDEKICPVVASYVRHARQYLKESAAGLEDLYPLVFEELDQIEESPLALVRDYTTQKLRSFYCLCGLFILLRRKMGTLDPPHGLPLTREGIQSLIKFCSEARDAAEVKVYADQLVGGSPVSTLIEVQADTLISLTDTIVEAAEYFRPRLATEGPLSGMGKFYAQGLNNARAPSDSFIRGGRELLNVPTNIKGDF